MSSSTDMKYMRRALQLAVNGRGHVSPNPMVGAVIVEPSGRIIGEGWHRRYGEAHAEVNAVRSVAACDRRLFGLSTIYVTLEPCSHYGKTPPCAEMLIKCGIGRVVVGAGDPNPRVAGRGIAMLREAGIEVEEGVLADECRRLNRAFMTAHTSLRPFVTLKWACSADGYMDCRRRPGMPAARFSNALSAQLVHLRRSTHDAIAVGAGTVIADNPRLDVRFIEGPLPRPVIFDRHRLLLRSSSRLLADDARHTIYIDETRPLPDTLHTLYSDYGITSLLVEGGAGLLGEFIAEGLWDEAYVEVADFSCGSAGTVPSPSIARPPESCTVIGKNRLYTYLGGNGR